MRKLIFWLVGVPLAIMVATFAANNLSTIDVDLWPLPFAVAMPVYLLFLGSLALGLIFGALLMWLSVLALRVRVYNRDIEIRSLKRNLDRSTVEQQKMLERATQQTKSLPSS